MNKFTIAFIFLLASSIASPLMAGDLDEPYNPSRKEWLELSIFKAIKTTTDMWSVKIAITGINVDDKKESVFIGITTPIGKEGPRSESVRKNCVSDIKGIVREFLKGYEWARDLKVTVYLV